MGKSWPAMALLIAAALIGAHPARAQDAFAEAAPGGTQGPAAVAPSAPARIVSLDARDPVFAQYSRDVEQGYKATSRRGGGFIPAFYEYAPTAGDTVFSIAARCSIPVETLVSVNGIRTPDEALTGKTLFLPTGPGLFVPDQATSALEELLQKSFSGVDASIVVGGRNFAYVPGGRFNGEARVFFLDPSFILPLEEAELTSSFGRRQSPLSGQWEFHSGVDLRASEGTPVMAAKSGTVSFVGWSDVYGNYIVVKHEKDMESLYGHLSQTLVSQGAVVSRGAVIGLVGTTGLSTGPHLHFEIHVGAAPRDPRGLVKNTPALGPR
jgi:murein DD-endopeptidase MepM/ murein hydrolase activator NlpD